MSISLERIALCADDYALAPGVCDAIEALIEGRRLSATGCMCTLPEWRVRAAGLRACAADRADVGLHLTLTEQAPITRALAAGDARMPPLGLLMRRAYARALPAAALADEIRAQFDAFEEAWGAPPDFVDGHQHVHLLPGVRGALLAELARRDPQRTIWVRDCREPPTRCLARRVGLAKALLIDRLARPLGRALDAAGRGRNDGFSGLHDFGADDFGVPMRHFLAHRGRAHLVHVHPGRVDRLLIARDRLTAPREREFAYLASARFDEDLAAAGVRIARPEPVRSARHRAQTG